MHLLSALLIVLTSYQSAPGSEFAALASELQIEVEERLLISQSYPAQTAPDIASDDILQIGLNELSAHALGLSLSIENRSGPEDLRCIYRGMAQDALEHRQELLIGEIRADRIRAYVDLSYLLDHATEVGPLSDQAEIAPFTGVEPGCPRGPLR